MPLTDRMAAALRDVISNGSEADITAAQVLLAEYGAPAPAVGITVGTRVRAKPATISNDSTRNPTAA